jgi:hypothetical protein
MERNEKRELKEKLRARHVNIKSLCREHGVPYKTFVGWLNGDQATLKNNKTIAKVAAMLADVGVMP